MEIAGAELLANCQESYGDQQKTWQTEIREKLQTSINNSTKIHEHEQDLIRKRQEEWKHAKDVRLIYERKLQRTNDLYNELSVCFAQLEEREREIAEREKQIGTVKPYKKAITQLRKQHFDKISRRRLHIAAQFTQANSTNSPSPPSSPLKTSLYVQLDGNQTKSVVSPSGFRSSKKTRHRRVGSGSSMNVKNIINRDRKQYESENRNSNVVDSHTQTDTKDVEESVSTNSELSEVTVKKNVDSSESSNESDIDDNVPQEDTTSSSQANNNQTMANSMATSIMTGSNLSYDMSEDMSEKHRAVASDDDNLESLRRKVNELIIETTNNIESYSTNSSTNTIINRNFTRFHSKTCEKTNGHLSCTNKQVDLPDIGFVDKNENLKDIKCNCSDDDENSVDKSIDSDVKSCTEDEEFDGPKKFNYSLRMKR